MKICKGKKKAFTRFFALLIDRKKEQENKRCLSRRSRVYWLNHKNP